MTDCLATWWILFVCFIDWILAVDWLGLLASDVWKGLTAIVLSVTMVYIIMYTRAAGRSAEAAIVSAEATRKLAEIAIAALQVDKDALDLSLRPIVSISYYFQNVYNFTPLIENRSSVDARIRIKASVVIDGSHMQYPEDSPYGGSKILQLPPWDKMVGNMKFEDFLRQLKTNDAEAETKSAQVTFETWSVNSNSDPTGLDGDNSKGPVVQFDWCPDRKVWIPEMSPKPLQNNDD